MLCMNHPENQASGVCPGCGAGICKECACRVVNESIWVCPEVVCHEKVENYYSMNQRALEIYQIGKGAKKRFSWLSLYFVSFGCVTTFFCLFNVNRLQFMPLDQILGHSNLFLLSIGLVMLTAGLYHMFRKNRLSI